jgi:predicted phosphodiesterase
VFERLETYCQQTKGKIMSRVLVIGDTHAPAMHELYIPFLEKTAEKWKTNKVVHIGDVVDHHSISFHDKHPDSPGALDEYNQASAQVGKLHDLFPRATITVGNHDMRVIRLNAKMGIPKMYVNKFNALYNTNGWKWVEHVEIDGVYYYHGEGAGGVHPAFNAAKMRMQSTVIGHYHSACGIWYQAGPTAKIWGMNVGSGVDRNHWAFQYGAAFLKKPIVACGVVIDGTPFIETMNLTGTKSSVQVQKKPIKARRKKANKPKLIKTINLTRKTAH